MRSATARAPASPILRHPKFHAMPASQMSLRFDVSHNPRDTRPNRTNVIGPSNCANLCLFTSGAILILHVCLSVCEATLTRGFRHVVLRIRDGGKRPVAHSAKWSVPIELRLNCFIQPPDLCTASSGTAAKSRFAESGAAAGVSGPISPACGGTPLLGPTTRTTGAYLAAATG